MRQNRKISTKMLTFLLPVVTIGLVVLMLVSILSSKDLIENEMKEKMQLGLQSELADIEASVRKVSTLADNIASMVGCTYKSTSLLEYETLLAELILKDDMVLGSGIWFEPYIYDEKEQYVGPYVYKEGDIPVTTYVYSNAEYNYFAYEFYTNCTSGRREPVFTEPYYDPDLDLILLSCSAPIYYDTAFIGVITVDVTLTFIQEIVKSITVGETGRAILLNSKGQYLYQKYPEKILNIVMTEDTNASFASAGAKMLKNNAGHTIYYNGNEKMHLYYRNFDLMGWRLGITMFDSEMTKPIYSLTIKLIQIGVIVLILIIILILLQISSISRQIHKVKDFAVHLASGNFTIDFLNAKRRDELGAMGTSLNEMYVNNKDIIKKITKHALILNASSQELSISAKELSKQFGTIEELMNEVNRNMSLSFASTEEVNASVDIVNSSVTILKSETKNSTDLSNEIKNRASKILSTSKESYDQAQKLTREHKESLNISIQKADVVSSISVLAEVIAGIAKQINMLSLNASIEAARAGEQGKGFAVVAKEIGELAGETSLAVNKIKTTIHEVQNAFNGLLNQSKAILNFVTDTVTPDYNTFTDVAKQYGNDAKTIEEFSIQISRMVEEIERIIGDVSYEIQTITESSQHTAANSEIIMKSVNNVSNIVIQINDMSMKQEDSAADLTGVVNNFTLDEM